MPYRIITPETVSDHLLMQISGLEELIEYHVLSMKRDLEGSRSASLNAMELHKFESSCLAIASAAARIRAYEHTRNVLGVR